MQTTVRVEDQHGNRFDLMGSDVYALAPAMHDEIRCALGVGIVQSRSFEYGLAQDGSPELIVTVKANLAGDPVW